MANKRARGVLEVGGQARVNLGRVYLVKETYSDVIPPENATYFTRRVDYSNKKGVRKIFEMDST